MARRLPPLNALRAFEAAARHLSFSRAADELNVTHAAVSHQIKALEEHLGVKLFRRLTRAVRLTDAGQALLPVLRDAFDAIAVTSDRLRAADATGPLNVGATPAFASRWLVPRLARFYAAHPEIEIRLCPSMELVDFTRDDIDLAVRFGRGGWPGLDAELLMCLDMFPVCSPALRDGPKPLREPADLAHHTLLHEDLREDWQRWLVAAGIDSVDWTRGPTFNETDLLLQAAVEGIGVAVAHSALVANDLARGRLVRPFEETLTTDAGFYVVFPEAAADRPKIKAFRDWLFAEAAEGEYR
ncbi:MAG: transcriptional regulator GcvA [Alphaproteobacteria bacterium]